MNRNIIKIEGLSKRYILGHQREGNLTFREMITESVAGLGRRLARPFAPARADGAGREEFWALKDVSFEVEQGERIGIIGRNGAGKSTLLKVLSRITEPTAGKIGIKGRIASLLEVGTGFHPELTGRENIYLNGAVLGMSRREIMGKFDEIVEFAEVAKFLDTPVKRYSSGMYVRLAFAVAAHLEPEILIVDEVLAVGDAQFQRKCLGKMEDVSAKDGRTVIFVSHNMTAIEQLCNKLVLLRDGRLVRHTSDIRSAIDDYLSAGGSQEKGSGWKSSEGYDNEYFVPSRLALTDGEGRDRPMPVRNDSEIWVTIEGELKKEEKDLTLGYAIYSKDGSLLYWSYQKDDRAAGWPELRPGKIVLRSKLPKNTLNEGIYRIELIASIHFKKWIFEPGKDNPFCHLSIAGGLSESPYWLQKRPGLLAPVIKWQGNNE